MSQYNEKGDAAHYAENRLQSIVKFERTYGTLAVMTFCEINADKYRERLGKKDAVDQELIKVKWYEDAAKFFFAKLGTAEEIVIDNRLKEPLPWNQISKCDPGRGYSIGGSIVYDPNAKNNLTDIQRVIENLKNKLK